ncbi:MAG: O-antigen ligase family protein [Chloroflexota bacterium]
MSLSLRTDSQVNKGLLLTIKVGALLILLTPLVVTPSTLFPYVVGKAVYDRGLIELIFACWLILAMRSPLYRPRRSWVLWFFGLYLFASLISAWVGVSFQRSFWGDYRRMGGVFDLAHWFALALVLVSVWREAKEWRWLLNASLGVSLLVALLGLAQHYDVRVFDRVFWYLQPTGRVDITFGNAAYVGAYMLVNIFVALAFLARSFQRPPQPSQRQSRRQRHTPREEQAQSTAALLLWRAFWTIAAVLALWVLTLSGTRGAAIGLVAGLLVASAGYALWGGQRRLRLLAGGLLVALLLAALATPLVQGSALVQRLAESNITVRRVHDALTQGLEERSIKTRLLTAKAGLEAFSHAPLLGWGPENFGVAFDRYADGSKFSADFALADQAHNKPVEELVTRGFVGFTIYALLVGRVVWVLIRALRKESADQLFVLFLGAAVIAYLAQNLFLFDTPGTFLPFLLLLGWVAWMEGLESGVPAPLAPGRRTSPSSRAGREARGRAEVGTGVFWLWAWLRENRARQGLLLHGATVVVLVLAASGLYYLDYQPYRAAQLFPVQGPSLQQFTTQAQRSFGTFPPLATLPRQILFETLSEQWDQGKKSEEALLLQQVQVEGAAALKSEPQNARLYLALARIYLRASASAPAYLPVARRFTDAAKELAPLIPETIEVSVSQDLAEQKYAGR